MTVQSEMDEKLCKSDKEKQVLQEEIEVRRGWEQEVCQLMNVNVAEEEAVVGAIDDDTPVSFMETIRQRVHEYQNDIKTKDELEQSLESCLMELDKAEADYQVSPLYNVCVYFLFILSSILTHCPFALVSYIVIGCIGGSYRQRP